MIDHLGEQINPHIVIIKGKTAHPIVIVKVVKTNHHIVEMANLPTDLEVVIRIEVDMVGISMVVATSSHMDRGQEQLWACHIRTSFKKLCREIITPIRGETKRISLVGIREATIMATVVHSTATEVTESSLPRENSTRMSGQEWEVNLLTLNSMVVRMLKMDGEDDIKRSYKQGLELSEQVKQVKIVSLFLSS